MTAPVSRTVPSSTAGRVMGDLSAGGPDGATLAASGPLRQRSRVDVRAQVARKTPGTMTPAERLAELGQILATGHRRFRHKALDAGAGTDAP